MKSLVQMGHSIGFSIGFKMRIVSSFIQLIFSESVRQRILGQGDPRTPDFVPGTAETAKVGFTYSYTQGVDIVRSLTSVKVLSRLMKLKDHHLAENQLSQSNKLFCKLSSFTLFDPSFLME